MPEGQTRDRASRPGPPGPGCACTTTKPPSAIAPAATSANRFRFIVMFFVVLLCALRAFQDDDRMRTSGYKFFSSGRVAALATASACPINDTCLAQASVRTNCNQSAPPSVIVYGVDALSTTWMILTQARWFRLRFSMMIKQLARWCGSFIRWSQKSSGRIDRAEPPRRTFAK